MKKSILNIGLELKKAEQKEIVGGYGCFGRTLSWCWHSAGCQVFSCPNGSDYCGPNSYHESKC